MAAVSYSLWCCASELTVQAGLATAVKLQVPAVQLRLLIDWECNHTRLLQLNTRVGLTCLSLMTSL
jgi:hypothetical protein